jgi:hypothetical protein
MFWPSSVFVPLLALLLATTPASADTIPDQLRAILEKAEHFELFSLNPTDPLSENKKEPKETFHGWEVLGKTTVKDAETRKKLVDAFEKGVADNKGPHANCFDPRHGIRVTHDGKTADFVICFECRHVHAIVGDQPAKAFLITDSPEAAFDSVLKEAKVFLAPKPKK